MSDRLNTNLKRRAASWAGQLTKIAKSLAPAHVKSAISSQVVTKQDGTYVIYITADRQKAPDARAQEFGSGEHAKRGPKETYLIMPKPGHKFLAFPWDVFDQMMEMGADEKFLSRSTSKFRGIASTPTEDGRTRYLFSHVDHPGIEAANEGRGYIAPAMKELKARAREQLTEDIRQAVVGDLRESFGKKMA